MRKTRILAVFLALAVAAPVATQAAVVNAGETQLADSLGLTPGLYSLDQMAQLKHLTNGSASRNESAVKYIIDNPKGPNAAAPASASDQKMNAGAVQLAELLGVTPDQYTLGELTLLARGEGDDALRNIYLAVLDGELTTSTGSDVGVVYPGKVQLAAELGVDPAGYTTQQLTQMKANLNTHEGSTSN